MSPSNEEMIDWFAQGNATPDPPDPPTSRMCVWCGGWTVSSAHVLCDACALAARKRTGESSP